ncbi:MAG: TlpA family protein disulfide reductase [Verrucomicrobia bacterium]|nr:TlpA family protein disulfide reductase [Verrucomicrobiota bacterium]
MKLFSNTSQGLKAFVCCLGLTLATFAVSAQTAAKADAGEDKRFEERSREVQERSQQVALKVLRIELEKGARELQKEFPKRPEVYELLFAIAGESEPEKAKQLSKEVVDGHASDEVKEAARGLLKKLEAVGKPVEMKFTGIDGREVDISKMKGKVVLIDFWATWCTPCVRELPNVQASYDKLHAKGFEIIGISFDQKKDVLEKFVSEKKMPWPQYFDGQGWGNKLGKEFGITSIPAMWLLDKNGILRDANARENLTEKVEKLLAEK